MGATDAFDTYVDAAVKRFQARHGIPVDGVVGDRPSPRSTSRPPWLNQLDQPDLPQDGDPVAAAALHHGQHPRGPVEAVGNGVVDCATPRSSASTGRRRS
jgi:peptidoglycan hydrolase-like protein with peptidoglycan-binding domain